MAEILIIDESDLIRDCLKTQLEKNELTVYTAINGLDGIAKMRQHHPSLVIMDYNLSRMTCKELLEEKARNPNIANIPVVITTKKIDKNKLLELVQFNIRKIITKPINMSILYQIITDVTHQKFEVEKTPCIIEAHVNDNIIFVEISQGLNLEKITLLGFKLRELISMYNITNPKIIVMITDMELSFIDGANLEVLIETVISGSKAKGRNIKILSALPFVTDFIKGRHEYADIEVLARLDLAIDGLLKEEAMNADYPHEKAEIISDKILTSQGIAEGSESIEMRFDTDKEEELEQNISAHSSLGSDLSVAVVDDDFIIQELIKTTFESIDAKVSTFSNGKDFIDNIVSSTYDLVFLDLRMPVMDGFAVLVKLRAMNITLPIIVLSALTQREAVIKAYQNGVRSYLVKPLKPEQIMKKTMEILKSNF